MTQAVAAGLFPALSRLDELLAHAVPVAEEAFGVRPGGDAYRGLYIGPDEVGRLLARPPGASLLWTGLASEWDETARDGPFRSRCSAPARWTPVTGPRSSPDGPIAPQPVPGPRRTGRPIRARPPRAGSASVAKLPPRRAGTRLGSRRPRRPHPVGPGLLSRRGQADGARAHSPVPRPSRHRQAPRRTGSLEPARGPAPDPRPRRGLCWRE